jgi:hypothetical protein
LLFFFLFEGLLGSIQTIQFRIAAGELNLIRTPHLLVGNTWVNPLKGTMQTKKVRKKSDNV